MPRSGLDAKDEKILSELRQNSRAPIARIASVAGLAATPCRARIRRLEKEGYIARYTIEERSALDSRPLKYMLIESNNTSKEMIGKLESCLLKHKSVSRMYAIEGKYDYLIRLDEYRDDPLKIILHDLTNIGIVDTLTFSVIEQVFPLVRTEEA